MQLRCRVVKNHESIENKGEFEVQAGFKRMINCAIRDVMAQLKWKWRGLRGAVGAGKMYRRSGIQTRIINRAVESLNPKCRDKISRRKKNILRGSDFPNRMERTFRRLRVG
jgi:hypothetical protein